MRSPHGPEGAVAPLNRILVIGVPRSGSTWVGYVLGHTEGAVFVDEPDNHLVQPFALRAKRRLPGGYHPSLRPGDPAPEYEHLWRSALSLSAEGRTVGYTALERLRRAVSFRLLASAGWRQKWAAFERSSLTARRLQIAERLAVPERPERVSESLVVKSVYATLAAEWIASRWPIRVVVVLRTPLNVLSSWAQFGWLGRWGDDILDTLRQPVQRELGDRWRVPAPPPDSSNLGRGAWLVGALTCELVDAAARNPAWVTVTHEDLCEYPEARLHALAETVGLRWGPETARLVGDMDRPGSGYELQRVARDLPGAWRSRLSSEQIEEARSMLERFPLDERLVSRVP